MSRAISYIDGFNLYFGLKSKGWRKYYWLDLARFSEAFLKPGQHLEVCHYFTARIRQSNHGQNAQRQKIWLEAIETRSNITTQYGHYLLKKQTCKRCHSSWDKGEEKMTDVNIAVQLLVDAFQDKFDTAIVISGDSDLTTPIKKVLELFPRKRVIVVFPPGRTSKELKKAASGFVHVGEDKLRANLLPNSITKPDGYILQRPREWY